MTGKRSATDSSGGEFVVDYEPHADGWLSTTVVRAVAAVNGEDTAELCPLSETVEPDVLNDLARRMGVGQNWRFEFALQNCQAAVGSERTIGIRDEEARE